MWHLNNNLSTDHTEDSIKCGVNTLLTFKISLALLYLKLKFYTRKTKIKYMFTG